MKRISAWLLILFMWVFVTLPYSVCVPLHAAGYIEISNYFFRAWICVLWFVMGMQAFNWTKKVFNYYEKG